jgi:hypothetical protein
VHELIDAGEVVVDGAGETASGRIARAYRVSR